MWQHSVPQATQTVPCHLPQCDEQYKDNRMILRLLAAESYLHETMKFHLRLLKIRHHW